MSEVLLEDWLKWLVVCMDSVLDFPKSHYRNFFEGCDNSQALFFELRIALLGSG